MDEKALNELLECSVCLDRLDSSSKVLPCQHTFCRWCLEEIVSTKKELRCPECRCLVETKIQDLPTNILLVRLLEGMKNAARSSGSSNKSSPSRASDKTGSGPTSPVHSNAEGGSQVEQPHKITDLINQPCAKALYNYEATEPGDLSFKKGDIILLRKQVDENWYHGELQGQQGFFPASYVQIVNPMSNKEVPSCKALYDFTDQNEKDCLMFQKDETMTVIRRIDDNWIEGKLGDNIGIFPKSFVEFNDAAKLLINLQASLVKASQSQTNDLNNQTSRNHPVPSYSNLSASVNVSPSQSSSPPSNQTPSTSTAGHQMEQRALSSPTNMAAITTTTTTTVPHTTTGNLTVSQRSHKRHSLTTLSPARTTSSQATNRHSVEVAVTSVSSPWCGNSTSSGCCQPPVMTPSMRNASQEMSSSHTSASSPISFYVALYAYKPQKEDEIELHKGDFYSVTEKCQDGWYKGVCLRTGCNGVFPGNYVQPVKMATSKASVSRSSSCVSAPSNSSLVENTSVTTACQVAAPSISSNRHNQISVTRTHSFPKTSLLSSLDSQIRMKTQGALHQRFGLGHPRPITNITQAQIRNTQSTLSMASAQSLAQSMMIPTSPVMSTGYPTSHLQLMVDEDNKSQSLPCGISTRHLYRNSQLKDAVSIADHGSPKSSRRHLTCDKSSKRVVANQDCHSSHHNYVNSSDELQSAMSTNTNITPPNVVIGATGGSCQTANKDKQEKKREKERLPISLMKKISAGLPMRVRKSKSPVPDGSKDSGSCSHGQPSSNTDMSKSSSTSSSSTSKLSLPSSTQSHNHTHHHRSGSAPGGSPSRSPSTASGASSHKKSSSDSSQHSSGKPGKVKPLIRERYQCIVPYPPQSDLELELKVGDIVYVHKKREDGWYKGILQSSGKMGLFPGSFVEKA